MLRHSVLMLMTHYTSDNDINISTMSVDNPGYHIYVLRHHDTSVDVIIISTECLNIDYPWYHSLS